MLACSFLRPAIAQSFPDVKPNIEGFSLAYDNSFDRRGYLNRSRMQELAETLQQKLRASPHSLSRMDRSYLLALLANAQTRLGDWDAAEASNQELAQIAQTRQQRLVACKNLAGNYATRGIWNKALHWYGRWVATGVLEASAPATLLCLGWIALWVLGEKIRHIPLRPGTLSTLFLLACLPVSMDLFTDIAKPLNSLLITGNLGSTFTTYRTDSIVTLLVSLEWGFAVLILAYWLSKRALHDRKTGNQSTIPGPSGQFVALSDGRDSRIRTVQYTGIICLGVLLMHGNRFDVFTRAMHNWRVYFPLPGHGNAVDILWVGWTFATTILSPVSEEVLFRGLIYRYLDKNCNVAFAVTFSSLLFAGAHFQSQDSFAWFFLSGTVFALQYEYTKRLHPCLITHMVGNLLGLMAGGR